MLVLPWDVLLVIMTSLLITYETQARFRYYVRYVLYVAIVMIHAIFLIPIAALRPGNVHNTVLVSYVLGPILNYLLGLKWQLRNIENLVDDGSIIVANHQSILDFLGMITFWPTLERCAAIAKKELNYVGPFGLVAGLCGTIFIKRQDPNSSKSTMNEAAVTVKKKKLKLWIFPEGTRSSNGMLPFKKGAFHLAITSQLPITPVVYSRYHFLDHKNLKFDNGEVIMTVLPSIPTKGMTLDEMPELMERVRNQMLEVYERTSKELEDRQSVNNTQN